MRIKQQGVTFIELMIVIAIVSILATVAISAYNDYIKKTKISEGTTLFAGFKTEVETFHALEGDYPLSLNSMPGLITRGTYITTMFYDRGPPMKNKICFNGFPSTQNCIEWVWIESPSPAYWVCNPSETGTTILPKYLPDECRR